MLPYTDGWREEDIKAAIRKTKFAPAGRPPRNWSGNFNAPSILHRPSYAILTVGMP